AGRQQAGDQLAAADPVEVGAAEGAGLVVAVDLEEPRQRLGDRGLDLVAGAGVEAADDRGEGGGEGSRVHAAEDRRWRARAAAIVRRAPGRCTSRATASASRAR